MIIVGIEIKERRKWNIGTTVCILHMQKHEASDLILVNVKNIK